MIKSLKVTNYLGESLIMELGSPEKSGFLIYNIEGLGPPKADINKTEVAVLDGSFFNSSRATSRNIRLSLIFLEFPTIEKIRLQSYKYFPIKKQITLELETDERNAIVNGYIESNEPVIFSKQQGTVISVVSTDSYFYEKNDVINVFGSLTSLFQFPFSNESTVSNLINFGNIILEPTKNIIYEGDASVGIVFIIHALGAATNIEIEKVITNQTISINTTILASIVGSGIQSGDDIIISTVIGEKYAVLIRSDVEYNILNAIGKHPEWFVLEKGDNLFTYSAETGLTNLQFTTQNRVVYEGV
jgi:hypothetical protein